MTESDILDEQESRQSPTVAALATSKASRTRQKNPQPPPTTATEESTTREASHARQGRSICCGAIFCVSGIFSLIVVALIFTCATGYEVSSVGLQTWCGPIFQAGAGVMSAYLWGQHATQQLYRRFPTMQPAPRHSSGQILGAGLGDVYSNLSQALAAGDTLFPVPSLISEKRVQAMRFRLPEGSLTAEPLRLFLQQSLHIDEDLIKLMLVLGQTAGTSLRQQQLTVDTLHSIQLVEYFGTFQAFRIRLIGTSTQESQLQTRLEEHLYYMKETIIASDQTLRKVLGHFLVLASTAEIIRNNSIRDRERLLRTKEETVSQQFWVFRASIYILGFPEPEDVAKISQNIELAESIYEWVQDIVDVLQRAMLHLECAKAIVGSLMETVHKFGTVTWDVTDKDRKIQEFLALIAEGEQLLIGNRAAWVKLQFGGYL